MTRPTWAEMRETSPALCEAVVGWIYAADLGAAWALLTKGHANTPDWLTDDLEAIRLRAAEYRMEAEASLRAWQMITTQGVAIEFVLLAHEMERRGLADALDAAADEAERRVGALP